MNAPSTDPDLAPRRSSRLSPITRRRLAVFRANRRARLSLWLFAALFVLSLAAELIANDRPIVMQYQGQWYAPVIADYPDTEFGGFLPSPADYRDPFTREEIAANGWMLWPPIPFSYETLDRELDHPAPSPPTARHWLGTDDQGRDVLARVIYGFRLSVIFALVLTAGSLVLGVLAGGIQGYFGGKVDLIGQRVTEIWSGLPMLFLLIILASLVEPNLWWLLGIMLLFSWLGLVDVVRAEFLRAQPRVRARRPRHGPAVAPDHVAPCAAQRHGRDPDLHPLPVHRGNHHPHRPGLPGLRPAAGLAVPGRAGRPGQEQPAGALARHHRLHHPLGDALAAGVHRRGAARCLRPAPHPARRHPEDAPRCLSPCCDSTT